LSQEQLNVFENQLPDPQAQSLQLFKDYGPARPDVMTHQSLDNKSPNLFSLIPPYPIQELPLRFKAVIQNRRNLKPSQQINRLQIVKYNQPHQQKLSGLKGQDRGLVAGNAAKTASKYDIALSRDL
jgi:hypothetical protein